MTKRLKRKHLVRENANLARAIDTLGDQLVAEQRKRKAALENVDKAVASGDEARNELAGLRRQLSNAREAQEKLREALYPNLGFTPIKVPKYTYNVVSNAAEHLSPNARDTARQIGGWAGRP